MAKACAAYTKTASLGFAAALALSLPGAAWAEDDMAAADETTVEAPLPEANAGSETPEIAVDPVPVDLASEEPLPDDVPVEWVIRGGEPDVMYMAFGMAGGGMEDVATEAAEAAAETALDHISADPSAPKAP